VRVELLVNWLLWKRRRRTRELAWVEVGCRWQDTPHTLLCHTFALPVSVFSIDIVVVFVINIFVVFIIGPGALLGALI